LHLPDEIPEVYMVSGYVKILTLHRCRVKVYSRGQRAKWLLAAGVLALRLHGYNYDTKMMEL